MLNGTNSIMFNSEVYNRLLKTIKLLPGRMQTTFAVSCSERSLLGFILYHNKSGRGDLSLVREIIDKIWSDLLGISRFNNANKYIDICAEQIDEDSLKIIEGSYAMKALENIDRALHSLITGKSEYAIQSGELNIDALDVLFANHQKKYPVKDVNDPNCIWIFSQVQKEAARQKRDIELLMNTTEKTKVENITIIMERAKKESKDFFDE